MSPNLHVSILLPAQELFDPANNLLQLVCKLCISRNCFLAQSCIVSSSESCTCYVCALIRNHRNTKIPPPHTESCFSLYNKSHWSKQYYHSSCLSRKRLNFFCLHAVHQISQVLEKLNRCDFYVSLQWKYFLPFYHCKNSSMFNSCIHALS